MKKLPVLTLMAILLALGSVMLVSKQSDVTKSVQEKCRQWGVSDEWVDFLSVEKAKSPNKKAESVLTNTSGDEDQDLELTESYKQAIALLRTSEQRLKQYHAIQAQIKQVIFMNGMKYQGAGEYQQSGEKRLKLSVQMQAGETTGDLLQVSDGQLLWTEYRRGPIPKDLPEDQLSHYFRVERRNLGRIEERLKQVENHEEAQLIWDLGAGGLCALLRSFRESLDFTIAEPQSVQGIPCYQLIGKLNEKTIQVANFLKKKREYVATGSVPSKVIIYLEQAQLFPLRYEYYRQSESEGETPLLQVEFSQIIFNGAPDLRAFLYNPPQGYFPHDVTRDFLERIKTTKLDEVPKVIK